MPNEPYVEEIMVADGDGDHPSTEEVKYEDIQLEDDVLGVKGNDETSYRNGYVNLTQDNIVGNNDTANISDSDLIIFKKNSDSKWYRKAFSKIWDYIKTKGDNIWLEKTKYNYNRELKLYSGTHYILIGEFPCYDHNITIEISTCYADPRYATAVMATRNINTTGAGTINWKCYDPDNKITGSLYAKYVNGSRYIAIYYVTESYPELLIRIQFQGSNYGPPLNIVKEVDELPAEATIRPTNVYGSSPKYTDTTYSVVSKTANGLAPKLPNETTTTKYLRQDGSWSVPPNDTKGNVISTYAAQSGTAQSAIATVINDGSHMDDAIKTLLDNDATLNSDLNGLIKNQNLAFTNLSNSDSSKYYIILESDILTALGATTLYGFYVIWFDGFSVSSTNGILPLLALDGNKLYFLFPKGKTFSNISITVRCVFK